ncbi:uncharacterized protein LOC129601902 [Paramacrobiotus metropolitanus]|uniref:uncharacterized protein LOC129601902 n=1 Tax=Paramacrobiotus metropolitanus TaxID=2943436 RepID=UPI00244577CE|nr:uncharacterized protein LOC129601902 [Paramacrobiotus metropolitanus]
MQFDGGRGTFGVVSIGQPSLSVTAIVPANRIRTHLTKWVALTPQDCLELSAGSTKDTSPTTPKSLDTAVPEGLNQNSPDHLESAPDSVDERSLNTLPAVILAEIFECLETPVRCRYRRVCSYWNGVLSLPRIQNQLRLHYGTRVKDADENMGHPEVEYLNAVCASKCWAPTIVITGSAGNDEPVFSAVNFLCIMVKFGHRQPRTLIVSDLLWNVLEIHEELVAVLSRCQTLIVRNGPAPVLSVESVGGCKILRVHSTNRLLDEGRQINGMDWMKIWVESMPELTETQVGFVLDGMGNRHRDQNGCVAWDDVKQALLEMPTGFADIMAAIGTSQITLQMAHPTAKDLARLELLKLSKYLQHYLLAGALRDA